MVQTRPPETRDEAVRRLAHVARERGLTVHWHDRGAVREYFVSSSSSPGLLHRCTLVSCDCEGFVRHQRCTHHARLLAELDELPDPEPPPSEQMVERRAERVAAMSPQHARTIEHEARRWLQSLLDRDAAGEDVPEADIREATEMVNLYGSIAGSNQPVSLAA
jgi:hypothetical protein